MVRSSYTPNLILLEPAEKSVTHRHTHEIRIKWEEKENWENMAKNREPEEKNCNREQNSFQNWSTNASMHKFCACFLPRSVPVPVKSNLN